MSEFDGLEKKLAAKKEWDASEPERIRKSNLKSQERLEEVIQDTDLIARLDSIVGWMNTKTGSSFTSQNSIKFSSYGSLRYYALKYTIFERVFFFKKKFFEISVHETFVYLHYKGSLQKFNSIEEFFDTFKNQLVHNINTYSRFKI